MGFFDYLQQNQIQIIGLLFDHVQLTALSVSLAIAIGVPLGIFIAYSTTLKKPILAAANVIQAIPSMALLGFMIPFLGIGSVPAIVAVVLYSLLPIIKNTYTGIDTINAQTLEAAKGIGLTRLQVLTKVQIPLALPVIMAGVRIASVTAVGLMTMASFIGADGLGYLVFSGIRTVNNNQIVTGALLACILALLVDYLVGLVEQLVTPINLQKGDNAKRIKNRRRQKSILCVSVVAVVAVFGFSALTQTRIVSDRRIAIGSKDYTEQAILGNLVSDMIEAHTDIVVDRRLDLGGTQVNFLALKNGDIDMYVEYTGSAYSDTLKHSPISDMQLVYDTVKKEMKELHDVEVLKQMSFNNTYVMSVTQETAEKYNLETISDFARIASTMRSGTVFEFTNREDGMSGLQKAYGFTMGQSLTVDGAPRYTALVNKEVDIIDAFSTDGLLRKFNLKTLEDDRHFFPPYYAVPIIRADSLAKFPEIVPILEDLGAVLTEEVMMELNYQVDELQQSPSSVARKFLKTSNLIP